MRHFYFVAPTFKESAAVRLMLNSIKCQTSSEQLKVFICNANPGDETSRLISSYKKSIDVQEVTGHPDEFWSASVNRGLSAVAALADDNDIIIILNVDIILDPDAIENLVLQFNILGNSVQCGGLGRSNGFFVPSGFRIKCWSLGLNYHPFAGESTLSVKTNTNEKVDALVGRFMSFPAHALRVVGFVPDVTFPHYNADLVYSIRLKNHGFSAYLSPTVGYVSDRENSGLSVYSNNNTNIQQRFENLFKIKNPSHPSYRLSYIKEVFPWYFWPLVMTSYLGRTFLEVLAGGAFIKRLFGSRGRGY